MAAPVTTPAEALEFLKQVSEESATHNCWAYKLGQAYRFSDDGEVSGTAGKPIFMALESYGFDQICAVVIRYYGGTKLGTGGLARAYGKVVKEGLADAPYSPILHFKELTCSVPYEDQQSVYYLTDQLKASIKKVDYDADLAVFCISVLESDADSFQSQLEQLSKGRADCKFEDA